MTDTRLKSSQKRIHLHLEKVRLLMEIIIYEHLTEVTRPLGVVALTVQQTLARRDRRLKALAVLTANVALEQIASGLLLYHVDCLILDARLAALHLYRNEWKTYILDKFLKGNFDCLK